MLQSNLYIQPFQSESTQCESCQCQSNTGKSLALRPTKSITKDRTNACCLGRQKLFHQKSEVDPISKHENCIDPEILQIPQNPVVQHPEHQNLQPVDISDEFINEIPGGFDGVSSSTDEESFDPKYHVIIPKIDVHINDDWSDIDVSSDVE